MQKEQAGLFILRVSLGLFLLLWSLDKLVVPAGAVKIFEVFYHMSISPALAYVIGTAEAVLSLLIIVGAWKRYTYAVGLVLHALSTLSTWKQLLSPFGQNHLFIAAIPVLAAFITPIPPARAGHAVGSRALATPLRRQQRCTDQSQGQDDCSTAENCCTHAGVLLEALPSLTPLNRAVTLLRP